MSKTKKFATLQSSWRAYKSLQTNSLGVITHAAYPTFPNMKWLRKYATQNILKQRYSLDWFKAFHVGSFYMGQLDLRHHLKWRIYTAEVYHTCQVKFDKRTYNLVIKSRMTQGYKIIVFDVREKWIFEYGSGCNIPFHVTEKLIYPRIDWNSIKVLIEIIPWQLTSRWLDARSMIKFKWVFT